MAKKITTTTTTKSKAPAVAADTDAAMPVKETKPRNSSVPPKAKTVAAAPTATTTEVTDDMVAEHAYHMWKNGAPGDQFDHWTAAERALRGKK